MDKDKIFIMLDGIVAQIDTIKAALNNIPTTVTEPLGCQHPRPIQHQTYAGTYAFCPDCNADLSSSVSVSG